MLALGADERTNTVRLAAYDIEGSQARDFHVERRFGIFVEKLESLFGVLVPIAIDRPQVATNPLQMSLQ